MGGRDKGRTREKMGGRETQRRDTEGRKKKKKRRKNVCTISCESCTVSSLQPYNSAMYMLFSHTYTHNVDMYLKELFGEDVQGVFVWFDGIR